MNSGTEQLNIENFRKTADRIDPKTRTDEMAKYDQRYFGQPVRIGSGGWHAPTEAYSECGTATCVAGHALIVAEGTEGYMKLCNERRFKGWRYVTGARRADIEGGGARALGLSWNQRQALFDYPIEAENIKREFGIKVGWKILKNAPARMAKLLRDIANKYEKEYSERMVT